MRAGTQAPPVPIAPIGKVVRRRVRIERRRESRRNIHIGRTREVRDLVPGVARLAEEGVGQLVLGGLVVRIRGRQLSPGHLRAHLGSLLDDEGVGADMVGLVGQGGAQGFLPVGKALPRRAVDEVNGRRQARFLRPLDDEGHPLGRMGAVESCEDLGDRRLHAEGDTRKTSVGQLRESLARHRVRIGLEGHLGTARNTDALAQARQYLGKLGSVEHRRGTSAKKDGLCLALGQPGVGHDASSQQSLGQDRRGIVPHLRARTEAHRVRVEVAVAAAHATKRHVHVQGERTVGLYLNEAGVQSTVIWPALTVWLRRAHERPPVSEEVAPDLMADSATGTANTDDVVGVTARIDASGLKVRNDASLKARGKSAALRLRILRIRTLPRIRVLEELAGLDDVAHLPGVVVPVGGQAPRSAIAQQARNLTREGIGDKATLAMPGLAPRVGEEGPDLVQARVLKHDRQGLGGVGLDDADVAHAGLDRLGDELGDTRNPDLESKKIAFGMRGGRSDDLFTRPRADLERYGCAAPKELGQIDREILRDRRVADAATRLHHVTVRVGLPRAHEVRGQLARAPRKRLRAAHEDRALGGLTRTTIRSLADRSVALHGLVHLIPAHFLPVGTSEVRAAMKASCGTSTRPMDFMRFLPSFCFSSSLRLRLMSPP